MRNVGYPPLGGGYASPSMVGPMTLLFQIKNYRCVRCYSVGPWISGVSVPTLLYSQQPNLPPLPTLDFLESCLWVLLTVLLFVAFSSLGAFLCIFIILFLVSLSTAPLPAQTHAAQSSGLLFLGGTVRHAVRQINDLHSQGLCFGDLHSLRVCVSKSTVTFPLTRSDNP